MLVSEHPLHWLLNWHLIGNMYLYIMALPSDAWSEVMYIISRHGGAIDNYCNIHVTGICCIIITDCFVPCTAVGRGSPLAIHTYKY